MSISYVNSATGTDTVTLPAHQVGDFIVLFAFRDGNNTQPTIPSGNGWVTIQDAAGASTCSMVAVGKIATTTSETVGTFTNATSTIAGVYRGVDGTTPFIDYRQTGGSATLCNIPALDGASSGNSFNGSGRTAWVVSFLGHRDAVAGNIGVNAPSGMVLRTYVVDGTDRAALYDTDSDVTSFNSRTVGIAGGSSGYRSFSVELVPATLADTTDDLLADDIETTPTLSNPVVDVFANAADFTDDFSGADFDAAKWTQYEGASGDASITSGRARLVATAAYSGLQSVERYVFTSSEFTIEVPQVATGGTDIETYMYVTDQGNYGLNRYAFIQYNTVTGNIVAGWRDGTGTTSFAGATTYNGTNHRWWKIRRSAGVVYWEVSSDRSSWTTLHSRTFTSWTDFSRVMLDIGAGTTGAFTTGVALFDNLNQASTVDTLLADDVTTTPELTSAVIGQTHVLLADDVETTPTLSEPSAGGFGALSADDITVTPTLSTPDLSSSGTGGGVTVPWTPLNISSATLVAWFDASDGSLSAGSVGSWASRIGSITATQLTSANQPVYSATGLNSQPAVTFDGTDRLVLSDKSGLPLGATPGCMFIVGHATGSEKTVMGQITGVSAGQRAIGRDSSNRIFYGIQGERETSTATWTSSRIVMVLQRTANTMDFSVDGTIESATHTLTVNTISAAVAQLGQDCAGSFHEMGFINGDLSTDERQRLEGYWAHKWGLTAGLPADHPYKTDAPTRTQLTHGLLADDIVTSVEISSPELDPPALDDPVIDMVGALEEAILTEFRQEELETGFVTSWLSGGFAPKTATQATVGREPSKLAGTDGVLFSAGQPHGLSFPHEKYYQMLHKWGMLIVRGDIVNNAAVTEQPIVAVHGISGGQAYRHPAFYFYPSEGKIGISMHDGVEEKTIKLPCNPNLTDWNVLVWWRREGTVFMSVNGVEAAPVDINTGFIFNNSNTASQFGKVDGTNNDIDFAIDAWLLGTGEPNDEQIRKVEAAGMYRVGLTPPPGHPYRGSLPSFFDSDLNTRYNHDFPTFEAFRAGASSGASEPRFQYIGQATRDYTGYVPVFFDDFKEMTLVDNRTPGGMAKSWYAPLEIGPGAIDVIMGQCKNARLTDTTAYSIQDPAGAGILRIRLWNPGTQWWSGSFASIDYNGQGRTWSYPQIREIKWRFNISNGQVPYGIFPAFWGYNRDKWFWKTRSPIEWDDIETDGGDYDWANVTLHVHNPDFTGNFIAPNTSQNDIMEKIAGFSVDPSRGFSSRNWYSGQWYTWTFKIEEDWTYVWIDGQELCRFQTPAPMKEPLAINFDLALKTTGSGNGGLLPAVDKTATYDCEIDYIKVMKPITSLAVVPAAFTARPTLSGTFAVGRTITCTPNVGGSHVQYLWYRTDGTPIIGATGPTLTLTAAEEGQSIRCHVIALSQKDRPEAWTADSAIVQSLGASQLSSPNLTGARGTTSFTMPPHQTGDLILVFAYRSAATGTITVPDGFTTFATRQDNSVTSLVAYKFAASSSETSGTWTNASRLCCHIYRGADTTTPLGNYASNGNSLNGNVITYSEIAVASTGSSWVAASAGIRTGNSSLETVPTGMRLMANTAGESEAASFDTNGPVESFAPKTISVGGTDSYWHSWVVEVRAGIEPGLDVLIADDVTVVPEIGSTHVGTTTNDIEVVATGETVNAFVTYPEHENGDVIVAWAWRYGSEGGIGVPSEMTLLSARMEQGMSSVVAYMVSDGTTDALGAWTNPGRIGWAILRNVDTSQAPYGTVSFAAGNSDTVTLPALTGIVNTNNTRVLVLNSHASYDTTIEADLTGYTQIMRAGGTTDFIGEQVAWISEGNTNTFAGEVRNVAGTSNSWHAYAIELRGDSLVQHELAADDLTAAVNITAPRLGATSTRVNLFADNLTLAPGAVTNNPQLNKSGGGGTSVTRPYGLSFVPNYVPPPYAPSTKAAAEAYAATRVDTSMWSVSGLDRASYGTTEAWLDACVAQRKIGTIGSGSYTLAAGDREAVPIFGYGSTKPIITCSAKDRAIFFLDVDDIYWYGVEMRNMAFPLAGARDLTPGTKGGSTIDMDPVHNDSTGFITTIYSRNGTSNRAIPVRRCRRAGKILVTGTSGSITAVTVRERKYGTDWSTNNLSSSTYNEFNLISGSVTYTTSKSNTAQLIVNKINDLTGSTGYSAVRRGDACIILKNATSTDSLHRANFYISVPGTLDTQADACMPYYEICYCTFNNVGAVVHLVSDSTAPGVANFHKNLLTNTWGGVCHNTSRLWNFYAAGNTWRDVTLNQSNNWFQTMFKLGVNQPIHLKQDNQIMYIENNYAVDCLSNITKADTNAGCFADIRNSESKNDGDVSISFNEMIRVKSTVGHEDSNAIYGKILGGRIDRNYIEDCGGANSGGSSPNDGSETSGIIFKPPGSTSGAENLIFSISGNIFKNMPDSIPVIKLDEYMTDCYIEGNEFRDMTLNGSAGYNGFTADRFGAIRIYAAARKLKIRDNKFTNVRVLNNTSFITFWSTALPSTAGWIEVSNNKGFNGSNVTYSANTRLIYFSNTNNTGAAVIGRNTLEGGYTMTANVSSDSDSAVSTYTYVAPTVFTSTSNILGADDLTLTSAELDSPVLGTKSTGMGAPELTVTATLGNPAFGQTHGLNADDLTATSTTLRAAGSVVDPTLRVRHILTADDVETTPELSNPTNRIRDSLTPSNLTLATPTLSNPVAYGQRVFTLTARTGTIIVRGAGVDSSETVAMNVSTGRVVVSGAGSVGYYVNFDPVPEETVFIPADPNVTIRVTSGTTVIPEGN